MIGELTRDAAHFIASYMRSVEVRERRATEWDFSPADYAERVFSRFDGPKYACFYSDGTPIVMGGLLIVRPGVARSWMDGTDDWPKVVREVTRYTRKVMAAALDTTLHRIETVSAEFHTDAHRWYPLLKLEHEATMPGYGANGETFHMYRRLRDVRSKQ